MKEDYLSNKNQQFYRYNLIVEEDRRCSVLVLTTDSYIDLISQNPGFIHENWGDFYSNFSPDKLSTAIYDKISKIDFFKKNIDDGELQIIPKNFVGPHKYKFGVSYFLEIENGICFYFPELSSQGFEDLLACELATITFVENLFFDKKKGSLQDKLNLLEKSLE